MKSHITVSGGKKSLFWILLLVVLFHVAWYAKSRSFQNRSLPDPKVLEDYRKGMISRMNYPADIYDAERIRIESSGNSLLLTVRTSNVKNANTIVFVPGTTAYSNVYAEYQHALWKEGYHVVGLDPRGHGESTGLRGDYTIQELTDDTLAAVEYAKKRFGTKVIVSGSSQGGIVAFYAAAKDDSIAAVVCHNLADLNGKDNLILTRFSLPVFLVPVADKLMELYQGYSIPVSFYLDLSREHFKDGTDIGTLIDRDPLAVTWVSLRAMRSLLKTPLQKPVEEIQVPVFLIHAEKDHIFPESYVREIYSRLRSPKFFYLVPGKEHMIFTNDVSEIVPVISSWLKKI
ncbi:putative lysophospholipase [Leptospira wolffii serovar Khorat str. Khorat-H2]|nr:putative lysophospholipase [Leptospira wolffii serovar Khorat str. Khorat-H2]